jgi:DNA modification methylase
MEQIVSSSSKNDPNEGRKPDQVPAPTRKPAKRCNELDGQTWTRHSISVWSDIRKTQEETALKHPALFPEALVGRLIEIFMRPEDRVVLDPFAGVGSTIVAARARGKIGLGIELSPEFAAKATERLRQKSLFDDDTEGEGRIVIDNATNVLEHVEAESVDLVITSPPYWDILSQKRTADYKATRDYGDEKDDLGKISGYSEFLLALTEVFTPVFEALRPGAYCCVIVMDIRKKSVFYPFHMDIAAFMQEIGFLFDDMIIWDRRHEYNSFRPLGYPSVFRVNKAHEFILIFQKPRSR